MNKTIAIFGGNAHPTLTQEVARALDTTPSSIKVERFSNGEISVEIGENVRGVHCYLIQPTNSWGPSFAGGSVNDAIMELLIMIDAFKRSSAASIVVVIPHFGYARQDRKSRPRTPISAKLVADVLTAAGATRVLAMDLHAGQIQGFFNIPFDHLYATPVFRPVLEEAGLFGEDVVVVSPDAGGVERARVYAKLLNCSLAIIDKRREAPGVSQVMNLIGDVQGKRAIIVDDMIDTAGTLCNAAEAVQKHGALEVHALATHGVFSGEALHRIRNSVLTKVWVTDTIDQSASRVSDKVQVVSMAPLLAKAIRCIHQGDSLSGLFV